MHVGIADLLRERDEPLAAAEHLAVAEALGEQASSHENRHRWFMMMARLRQAEGQLDAALDLVSTAEGLYRRGFFPEVRPIAAMKARIWIQQGRFDEAAAWARDEGLATDEDLSYLREFGHITVVKLLIAQHRAEPRERPIQTATGLLSRLLAAAEAGGRTGSAIEILVLQALANQAQGRIPSALPLLERALTLSEPEGYIRLFADGSEPMAALLRAAGSRPSPTSARSPRSPRSEPHSTSSAPSCLASRSSGPVCCRAEPASC